MMCGIIGYVGNREAEPILIEGLRRLEYRGYDSADLVGHLRDKPAPGCHGISHTRWATHGPATDHNAHPHIGGNDLVAVVHNGVIENYAHLKSQLQQEGIRFYSDTDTEVIAQLIAQHFQGDLVDAVRKTLALLK